MAEENKTYDKEGYVVNTVNRLYTEAENSRKPVKRMWDTSWALYNQQYDFSQKEPWQHKVPIPKISGAVRTAVALFKQALVRSADWFAVKTPIKRLKQYSPFVFGMLSYWIERINFINIFCEALHSALLSNLLIFKVFWVREKKKLNPKTDGIVASGTVQAIEQKEQKKGILGDVLPFTEEPIENDGRLVVYAVDPYNFFIDPTGRNKYVIETIEVDFDDFIDSAEDKGYDMKVVEQIENDYAPDYNKKLDQSRREGKTLEVVSQRKKVQIKEFWGDIQAEDGKSMYRNVACSIANDKYLIRKPTPNPFWHGKFPYVWGPITRKPFSVWHKGFLDDLHGIQIALTELVGVILDSNLSASINAFELDIDQVADPEQFKNGIWAGKTYKKNGGMAGMGPMISNVQTGIFNPHSMRVFSELDRQFQNESIITEFVSGGVGARGRATATEVISKTNQANTLIQDIAVDVENFVLAPLLERMFQVIFNYQRNFSDERYTEFVNEELLANVNVLSDEQRKEYLDDKFFFKVSGISGYINRISQVQKIQVFVQVLQYAPELIRRFKLFNFLKKIVEWLNWDAEEILYTDEEMKGMNQPIVASGIRTPAGQPEVPQNNINPSEDLNSEQNLLNLIGGGTQ